MVRAWRGVRRDALHGFHAYGLLPLRLAQLVRVTVPERLLIAPQDIRTTDPTIALQIYAGWFSLAGQNPNAHGRSPFEIEPPSLAWQAELEGFGWLRHLRAADTALTRLNARALVSDWLDLRGSISAMLGGASHQTAWVPEVAARRLISFLSQSPLLLEGADGAFYHRFMVSLARHGALLRHALATQVRGESRLVVCVALCMLGLCAQDFEAFAAQATQALAKELAIQVLPDGGHIGRNPQTLVNLLLDLLPLRRAYATRGLPPPEVLLNSIDRIMPMLRLFRHSNGSLALFNGMGPTEPDTLATVLAYDDARAAPLEKAPASGYQRLQAGPSVVIMDTGCPPKHAFSTRAHAGTLAFELSSTGQMVVVNCGTPEGHRAALQQAARRTAAHSTLVLADASSSVFGEDPASGPPLVAGPTQITLTRDHDATGVRVLAGHDGYVARFGYRHLRALSLSADGLLLEGVDTLVASDGAPPPACAYAVRFHMAPEAVLTLAQDQSAALITLSDGQAWVLSVTGFPLSVDESVAAASPNGPRTSQQLVIALHTQTATRVAWRLKRRPDLDLHLETELDALTSQAEIATS